MKLEWFLLATLLGVLAAVGAAIGLGEPPGGHGYADATFGTLQVGGDGVARSAPILGLGWLVGALVIAFFVGCLALGLRRRVPGEEPTPPWRTALLGWGAAFEAVWLALVAVYWHYASTGSTEIWLGLPAPTAIMLYGIWLVPLGFCALYVLRFDSWVMSEADLARFDELVDRSSADAPGSGDPL